MTREEIAALVDAQLAQRQQQSAPAPAPAAPAAAPAPQPAGINYDELAAAVLRAQQGQRHAAQPQQTGPSANLDQLISTLASGKRPVVTGRVIDPGAPGSQPTHDRLDVFAASRDDVQRLVREGRLRAVVDERLERAGVGTNPFARARARKV